MVAARYDGGSVRRAPNTEPSSAAGYAKADIHSSSSCGSGDCTEISSPEDGWWNRMRWACRK